MDYCKIYNNLIQYRLQNPSQQGQKHHIIPTCLGIKCLLRRNLVKLSFREHWFAHLLLTKIYPNQNKLKQAFWMMCNLHKLPAKNSKQYQKLREQILPILSKSTQGRIWIYNPNTFHSLMIKSDKPIPQGYIKGRSPKAIQNMKKPKSIKHYGIKPSQESREKMRKSKLGIILSQEHKQNISRNSNSKWKGCKREQLPWYGRTQTEQTKTKISQALKGKPKNQKAWNIGKPCSQETKVKLRESYRNRMLLREIKDET